MALTPLNALNAFLAVGRRRSFASAATELGLSPSALSQQVRQLEARLGVPLLTRTTRSVALTDAGQRLMERAGPSVEQALEALQAATASAGEVTGRVRLSVPTISLSTVVTPLLLRFAQRHPQVEVELRIEDRFVDIVAEGLDAGIRPFGSVERDMVQVRLSKRFRYVVVGAPSYLKRKGVPQKPEDLLEHDCLSILTPSGGVRYAWELERGRKKWRIPVRGPLLATHEEVQVAMAEAGLALMYAFEPTIVPRLKRGTLKLVLEPYAAWEEGLFLYFPSRAQVSPAFRAFLDVAREVTAERT
ncbi:LysR substrate-binding domain-containing protein [Corallococcus aberystwythensis]|uniref:LysR family transcriptional regulator n=1 Tax=Corallococcus aberystwythensis TaxID=2316722 RepID=A0A3A8QD49_9BACT|nr:LysR substrate-binding domain-containing protein [Corallococcus aberystwythensis]RKH66556.1 LysR family transcriptional regulator [Corallococcus aberystwythensis]